MTPRCVLAGASGLVGRALAEVLAADPDVTDLHLLLRRAVPALEALPHAHRIAWDGGPIPELPPVDTAISALGTTIAAAGSQAAFRAVDFDAVLGFARAAQRAGARRFGLVSALGADAASRVFYNRTKGEAEQAIATLGFDVLVIARPSLLLGDRVALGQPARPAEAVARRLAPLIGWLAPPSVRPIDARTVARALLAAIDDARPGRRIVRSEELQSLGRPR